MDFIHNFLIVLTTNIYFEEIDIYHGEMFQDCV